MKIKSRIKLIALAVSMTVSLSAVAAPEANVSEGAVKQQESGQYIVRQGETVAQIAARIRPENMSLRETIRVLVKANPKLFRNGNINFIRVGDVLVIPEQFSVSGERNLANGDEKAAVQKENANVKQAESVQRENSAKQPDVKELTKEINSEEHGVEGEKTDTKNAQEESNSVNKELKAQEKSMPSASEPNSASQEVASPPIQTNESNTNHEQKKSSSLIWVVLGAGLLALFAFNKMKGNKKAADQVDLENKPSKGFEDLTVVSHEDKNEEDALFFKDAQETEGKATAELPVEDVNIDLSSLDDQAGIVSGAVTNDEETNKRRDANWDEIESTDSVYEEEPKPGDIVNNNVVDVDVVEEEAEERLSSADTDHQSAPLEFDLSDSSEELHAVESQVEQAQAAETVEVGSFIDEEAVKEEIALKEVSIAEPVVVSDDSIVEGQVESESIEFKPIVEDEQETAVESVNLEESSTEDDIGQPVFAANQDGTEEQEGFLDTHITEADEDTVIEWDSVQIGDSNGEVGFVSESVGMTAPLEAKYELAQMYIEIGDPEAARETLNELVEEANGDILAKSKALLAELG